MAAADPSLSLYPYIPTSRNRLLSALPPDSLARLWPQLTPVELELREVLHRPEVPITTLYFPESGWASMLAPLEDGDVAEVGLIGYEGVVGLPVVLGEPFEDLEAMVQCQGAAHSPAALCPAASRAGGTHGCLQRPPPHRAAPGPLALDGT